MINETTPNHEEIKELTEELIISQIIRNALYRDNVLTELKPSYFEDIENAELFKVMQTLVLKDKIQKIDKKTLRFKFNDAEKLDAIFAEEEYPAGNIDFLMTQTETWGKENAMVEAVMESAEIIEEKKDTGRIGKLIEDAMSFSFDRNLGMDYINDLERRIDFYTQPNNKLSTGFVQLDEHTNGGLPKKTLSITAGSSGLGKTLFGTNLASNFMKQGYNGVYITLELAEELIGRRVDSITTGMDYGGLSKKKNTDKLVTKLKHAFQTGLGRLFIKEYPPSKACCLNLKSYLKELELIEKIKPEFLIVDYIQLMKPNNERSGQNSYDKYKEIAEELRELAMEFDIPVITFSQVRRDGYNTSSAEMTQISDSMGIVNTADLVVIMSHYEPEEPIKDCKPQLWKIVKNRLGMVGNYFVMLLNTVTLKITDDPDETEKALKAAGEEMTSKNKEVNGEEESETENVEDSLDTNTNTNTEAYSEEDFENLEKESAKEEKKIKDEIVGAVIKKKKRGIDNNDKGSK